MAEFNPAVRADAGQGYLNQSKGVDVAGPNKSFEKLFEGLGGAFDAGVTAVDKGIKTDINRQVDEGVDRIRGEVGVDLATDKAAQTNTLLPNAEGTPVPGAITKAQSDVARLKEAYDQGKINDSYYWGRVNALSKQIRTQYPGYRDEIDASFSSTTGSNPANALRKAVQADFDSSQAKLSSAQSKLEQFEISKAEYIGQAFPNYYKDKQAGNAPSLEALKAGVGTIETQNQIAKQKMQQMDLLDKQGKLDSDQAQTFSTARTAELINTTVVGAAQGMDRQIQEALKTGKPIPPEMLTQFRASYNTMRLTAESKLNAFLNTPIGDDKTRTMASIIKDSGKLKAIRENALGQLDAMKDALESGQYGIFAFNANMAKATTDSGVATMLQNSDAARKVAVARDIAGPAFNVVLSGDGGAKLLSDFQKAALGVGHAEAIAGEGNTVDQLKSLTDPNTKQKANGPALGRFIDGKTEILTSKDANDTVKANVVKSTFGGKSADFLNEVAPDSRLRVFQRFTSPEVTKEMVRLKGTNPEAFQTYRDWSTNSFKALLKTQADTVQAYNAGNTASSIVFDPATMQFTLSAPQATPGDAGGAFSTGVQGDIAASAGLNAAGALQQNIATAQAQRSLGEVNAALKNLKPIIEGETKDPNALAQVLTGIDLKNTKNPGFIESLGSAVVKGLQNLNPISKAKADTLDASAMKISLDDYTPPKDVVPDTARGDLPSLDDIAPITSQAVYSTPREGVKGLLDVISQGESGGSYNKISGGKEVPLTNMTLGQVFNLQSTMINRGSPSTAVGKYQFINGTLRSVAQKMGVGPDEPFTPELQDKLAIGLLQGRGLNAYLSGKLSESSFLDNISKEWAAVPNSSGRGTYDGDGKNMAKKNVGEILEFIRGLKA